MGAGIYGLAEHLNTIGKKQYIHNFPRICNNYDGCSQIWAITRSLPRYLFIVLMAEKDKFWIRAYVFFLI